MAQIAHITIGPSASGKSTYAKNLVREHDFHEINLDHCRYIVSGDESNQECTPEALKLHTKYIDSAIADELDVVVSDTNLDQKFRTELVRKFLQNDYSVIYVVFDVELDEIRRRNQQRGKNVPDHVLVRQHQQMREFLIDHPQVIFGS